MVQVDLKALKAGTHEFEWTLSPEDLGLDSDMFKEVELFVQLDYHPSRVFVKIYVDSIANLTCDRTLVGFEHTVEGEYNILYSGPEMFEGMEQEEEDIRLLTSDMEEIDLTDAVRDTLLLALPQRRIAPGAEDEDIKLQFGAPEVEGVDIDPRWEALRVLKGEASDGN